MMATFLVHDKYRKYILYPQKLVIFGFKLLIVINSVRHTLLFQTSKKLHIYQNITYFFTFLFSNPNSNFTFSLTLYVPIYIYLHCTHTCDLKRNIEISQIRRKNISATYIKITYIRCRGMNK